MPEPLPPLWLEGRAELDAADAAHLERARALVASMDVEEKLPFLHQHSPGLTRLGIGPFSTGTEVLHGVAWRGPAVTYPQPVGLAATWDENLLEAVGGRIAQEVRVHHEQDPPASLNVWAPVVNPLRHPLWGRTEEGLSEDPLLNARLGAAIARGLRGRGRRWETIPTLKHFLGYSHETDRAATSSSLPPRVLHEYELPGFEEALARGVAGAVMLSYNLVDGFPAHLSPLVNGHLRRVVADPDLLFVVSDAGAPTNLFTIQEAVADLTESVAAMLRAGVDSFTDHDRDSEPTIRAAREALNRGLIQEQHVDHAVVRQLVARARTGEFDDPTDAATPRRLISDTFDRSAATALAEQVAGRAAVLLRHEAGTLPARSGDTLAVLGHLGGTVLRDWYSGELVEPVPLDAALSVAHQGTVVSAPCLDVIHLAAGGAPAIIAPEDQLQLPADPASARPAAFQVLDHGDGVLSLRAVDTDRWIAPDENGYLRARAERIGGWIVQETFRASPSECGRVRLQHVASGRWVCAERQTGKLILGGTSAASALLLDWTVISSRLEQARAALEGADLAIVVAGNEPHVHGRETEDRPSLQLKRSDRELLDLLTELPTQTRTALVIISSYPFDLRTQQEAADAVVWSSHAGARQGPALASLLVGEQEFSGRLAQAWSRETSLTDILEYDVISSGATYLYGQQAGFPFGHGLTTEPTPWTGCSVEAEQDAISVRLTLERAARTSAHEVVQVYAAADASHYPRLSGPAPVQRLIDATVVEVPAAGTVGVHALIPWSRLRLWSEETAEFVDPRGPVTIHLARSAADLVLSQEVIRGPREIPPA